MHEENSTGARTHVSEQKWEFEQIEGIQFFFQLMKAAYAKQWFIFGFLDTAVRHRVLFSETENERQIISIKELTVPFGGQENFINFVFLLLLLHLCQVVLSNQGLPSLRIFGEKLRGPILPGTVSKVFFMSTDSYARSIYLNLRITIKAQICIMAINQQKI